MRIKPVLAAAVAGVLAVVPFATSASAQTTASAAKNYLVLYKGTESPANAAATIASAGGTLIYDYSDIGVAVAHGSDSVRITFGPDSKVQGVVRTARFSTKTPEGRAGTGARAPPAGP